MAIITNLQFGGSGGVKNYLGTVNNINGNGNFELNTTAGWGLLTVGAIDPTTKAVSGTITASAASITTFATVSSGQLAGSYSLNTASTGATTVGQGFISTAWTIDLEDQAKMQTVTGYYSVVSGAANLNFSGTSSNTWAVWIYDTTNSAWIQPAGVYSMVQSSGVGQIKATFQTSSNGTQYRLALVCINASAGATSMLWDDFTVGPQTSVSGPAVSDTTSSTGYTFNNFSASLPDVRQQRIGDRLFVWGKFTSGTPSAAIASIQLPAGTVIDSSKLTSASQVQKLGTLVVTTSATNSFAGANPGPFVVFYDGSTTDRLFIASSTTSSVLVESNASAISVLNSVVSFDFTVPILGWSSNSVMSADTDTRVVAMQATGVPANATAANPIIYPTTASDTHGAYNSVTGRYTVPVTGYYSVAASFAVSSNASADVNVYINGTISNILGFVAATQFNGTTTIKANAGDIVDIRPGGTLTTFTPTARYNTLSISRLSGPAVVAASESVNARYTSSSSSISSSVAQVVFPTKSFDSHSAYNTSTGNYAVPVPGKYLVATAARANSLAIGNQFDTYVYKNGTLYSQLGNSRCSSAGPVFCIGTTLVDCVAGDVLSIWSDADSATTLSGTAGANHVSITRVGN